MPIYAVDYVNPNKLRPFFQAHCNALNATIRRLWVRRPKAPYVKEYDPADVTLCQEFPSPLMSNVMFGALDTLRGKGFNFLLLTRYLVFNEVTGAVHLFKFQYDHEDAKQQEPLFYPRLPLGRFMNPLNFPHYKNIDEEPLVSFDREDTAGYVRWYIKHAYEIVKEPNRGPNTTPSDDLNIMCRYWTVFFHGQDTKIICLELDQKFLFVNQVEMLKEDLELCSKYVREEQLQ
jgi:hypothetical protein